MMNDRGFCLAWSVLVTACPCQKGGCETRAVRLACVSNIWVPRGFSARDALNEIRGDCENILAILSSYSRCANLTKTVTYRRTAVCLACEAALCGCKFCVVFDALYDGAAKSERRVRETERRLDEREREEGERGEAVEAGW